MRKLIAALALAGCGLASLLTPATVAAQEAPPVPQLHWTPCTNPAQAGFESARRRGSPWTIRSRGTGPSSWPWCARRPPTRLTAWERCSSIPAARVAPASVRSAPLSQESGRLLVLHLPGAGARAVRYRQLGSARCRLQHAGAVLRHARGGGERDLQDVGRRPHDIGGAGCLDQVLGRQRPALRQQPLRLACSPTYRPPTRRGIWTCCGRRSATPG